MIKHHKKHENTLKWGFKHPDRAADRSTALCSSCSIYIPSNLSSFTYHHHQVTDLTKYICSKIF